MQAKLANKWEDYVGQLAAEIMGSREDFALKVLGKRKSEAVEAMSKVRQGEGVLCKLASSNLGIGVKPFITYIKRLGFPCNLKLTCFDYKLRRCHHGAFLRLDLRTG